MAPSKPKIEFSADQLRIFNQRDLAAKGRENTSADIKNLTQICREFLHPYF
jgi:hypothetical protein